MPGHLSGVAEAAMESIATIHKELLYDGVKFFEGISVATFVPVEQKVNGLQTDRNLHVRPATALTRIGHQRPAYD